MEKAAKFLDEMEIPFEMHALSAHRTPLRWRLSPKELEDVESRLSSPLPEWPLIFAV